MAEGNAGLQPNLFARCAARAATVIAIVMSLFYIYTSVFGVLEAWRFRSIHVIFILLLANLIPKNMPKRATWLYQSAALALSLFVSVYMLIDYRNIIYREVAPNTMDKVVMVILVVLMLDIARRWIGNSMAVVAAVFFLYALFGYILPGKLAAPMFSLKRLTAQFFNSTNGLMGSTTGVAATSVIMFIIFGAMLNLSGGSKFFNDIAILATRKLRGGPAKAAVICCALIGMIQGNAVSNVVTTGTFTIPLMEHSGYSKEYSAGVVATAATGGMIMPPVMGAAAFLVAEYVGVSYGYVVRCAIIPACLYYLGVFMMVHLHAVKLDLKVENLKLSLDRKHLIWMGITCVLPLITLIYMILAGYSAQRSATFSIFVLLLIWLVRPVERLSLKSFLKSMEEGSKGMITVSAACITACIVVASVSVTGFATKIATLVSLLGANVWLVLILAMIVCIIFGMGLPVSASYVIAAVTLGGILGKVGIETLNAHMYLMYFATFSAITPPVALASYAAAGIAKTSPNAVGLQAVKIALPAFIIPYVFAFGPELLMQGSPLGIILAVVSSSVGIIAFAAAMEGYCFTTVKPVFRILFGVASLLLIIVGSITDLVGAVIFVAMMVINFLEARKDKRGPAHAS
mgnify:CR=1 FL=1